MTDINVINELIKNAARLKMEKDYSSAFALYWVSFEATIARACVKGLWLRGANINEAEDYVRRINFTHPDKCLTLALGRKWFKDDRSSLIGTETLPFKKLRNWLFHVGYVPDTLYTKNMSTFMEIYFNDIESFWEDIGIYDNDNHFIP